MSVASKVCLVTGAATGIGSGVARGLLEKGAKVFNTKNMKILEARTSVFTYFLLIL